MTNIEDQAADVAHTAEKDTRGAFSKLVEWAGKELKTAGFDVEAEISAILAKIKSHV